MTKPLHGQSGSVEEELDALQANAARDAQGEERFAWTISLSIPSGRLRWRAQPFRLAVIPDEQDDQDQRDAISASLEDWKRETRNNAAFAAWTKRLRHLGLLKPQRETRIPWLPTGDGCQCPLCRPSLRPLGWSPWRSPTTATSESAGSSTNPTQDHQRP